MSVTFYGDNDSGHEINFANVNALAILAALGLPCQCYGEIPLDAARRAVIRARNRDLAPFARVPETEYGSPRRTGTIVELRPLRYFDPGQSADALADKIDRFSAFIEAVAASGGTRILWA